MCWDDHDIMEGRPTGAVRVSFGYMSTYEDAAAVISFVREFFGAPAEQVMQATAYQLQPVALVSAWLHCAEATMRALQYWAKY